MPFLGIGGRGQIEGIQRGERTPPLVIIEQGLGLAVVLIVAGVIVRVYIRFWSWMTDNGLHSWFAPPAIILVGVCLVVAVMLFIEIYDPNWPNPRAQSDSTRPNLPWSRERRAPPTPTTNINVKFGIAELIDLLSVESDEDDDELE